jgi:hypothetical protein
VNSDPECVYGRKTLPLEKLHGGGAYDTGEVAQVGIIPVRLPFIADVQPQEEGFKAEPQENCLSRTPG